MSKHHPYYPRPKNLPPPTWFEQLLCIIGLHNMRLIRERYNYADGEQKKLDYKCKFCNHSKIKWDWDDR